MKVRNCPECGRLFDYIFRNICPECLKQEDGECAIVRTFLQEHPGTTIPEISEITGVNAKVIIRMLKDGRLEAVCKENDIKLLNCERCGEPITGGRFCLKCRASLRLVFGKTVEPEHTQDEKVEKVREDTSEHRFTEHFVK